MRSSIVVAVLTAALVSASSASAMTCEEFETRVQAADRADLLRDFEMTPNESLPEIRDVENLPNIMLGISCPEGRFEGLGSSLTSGSETARMRWAVFTASVMRALAPEGEADAMPRLAADLTGEANDDASRREIRDGLRFGTATRTVGDWVFLFESGSNYLRFEVDTPEDEG